MMKARLTLKHNKYTLFSSPPSSAAAAEAFIATEGQTNEMTKKNMGNHR
jgi:hypothetical protein